MDAPGQEYALTLRTPSYAWWRPISGLLVVAFWLLAGTGLVAAPILLISVGLDHQGSFDSAYRQAAELKHVVWQGMLALNLALASMIVVTCALLRFVHGVAPGRLLSVAGRVRWRFFGACFGVAVLAIGAQLLVSRVVPNDQNGLDQGPNHLTARLLAIGLVVLLTTPLQAMGEEFAFRGYLLQAFGALSRRPWVAVVTSALLFALAHGVQNAPLFADRFTFGLLAGYLVVRTGGLEASIALHIWNNLVSFGLALGLGNIDKILNLESISWWNIPLTITQNGVFLVLVLVIARRMGITPRSGGPVLAAPSRSV
ncbi:MAG: Abortive infection protein [Marmoricola sp.]|nr:Abortive infection protein [Marmoricola sp.]